MSNEQEQVVGIEEALAKAYAQYMKFAYEFAYEELNKTFDNLEFVNWVHTSIEPQPEWTRWEADDLVHLHRLIKNADMKTAGEIANKEARESSISITRLLSFKSFVQDVIWSCEGHGPVPKEDRFELHEEAQC